MSEARRIVVTGVSRGLGRELVRGFLQAGHIVFGCARSASAISDLQQEFPANANHAHFAAVDVADDRAVEDWAKSVLANAPAPDLLINNAALMNEVRPLWEVPAEEFAKLIAVNVAGTFHVIRHFVPAMVAAQRGIIVNLSSGWGRGVSADVAPYCASKWAIEGMTRAMAEELPRGMAAIPLNPGIINTDMLRVAWADGANAYPSPAQWAKKAVPFLLSLSAKDNGHPLTVPQ